jgi:hypothetical protein
MFDSHLFRIMEIVNAQIQPLRFQVHFTFFEIYI